MMLSKHSVNVHVQFASTTIVVTSIDKAHVDTFSHQFANDRVITLIATNAVPAKTDNAFEVATAQVL
ncbi:hypothetical protein COT87_01825 [Candidatus Collierbacteria bacterium CG10_big_fil_rev_8_21_14_0_10_44_9]|uniref:Uncharacterized protein n=1 Tax=Candidatus Collierbacteria bacterium CG10_big_fil_rev_8_21_14_0_10_44_9 TaxID=1974535 RepID=A0A2H0VKZ7_9BACT|nr:MAG: hypothetical protein COT87_01825 [Candidatus Collierbacteria bacterium CG10_big_fil_rev_8_21_14_0_10_44_9]